MLGWGDRRRRLGDGNLIVMKQEREPLRSSTLLATPRLPVAGDFMHIRASSIRLGILTTPGLAMYNSDRDK